MLGFSWVKVLYGLVLLALLPLDAARAQLPGVSRPVIKSIHITGNVKQDSLFRLGNTITLEVNGLNRWMLLQELLLQKQGFSPEKAHAQAHNLVLFIDDAPLIGMPPLAVYANETTKYEPDTTTQRATTPPPVLGMAPNELLPDSSNVTTLRSSAQVARLTPTLTDDPGVQALLADYSVDERDKVVFKLTRNMGNFQYWDVVYDSPWNFSHPGKIGLGYADRVFTNMYPGDDKTIHLALITQAALWTAVIGTLCLALAMLVLGTKSWLLREYESHMDALTMDEAKPPYSLAKVQLGWWTFIIMSSYLIIYCATGEMTEISTTTLALLGISAGTTAVSGALGSLTGSGNASPADKPVPKAVLTSRGWFLDLLSDGHGVSMARLQKVVITLTMGYFFVRSVYETVAMPVWTTNQTLLLAVSSAAYLGLKWGDKRGENSSTLKGGATDTDLVPFPTPDAPVYAGPDRAQPLTQRQNGDFNYTPSNGSYNAYGPSNGTYAPQPNEQPAGRYVPPRDRLQSDVNILQTAAVDTYPAGAPSGALAETGEVLHREEDDMGPPEGAYIPSESESENALG